MSHPERLGATGGGSAGTIAERPEVDTSLADFAAQHGLSHSAARPPLGSYVRQLFQRRHFIWAFASAKSTSLYTGSKLGQLWQVLTPLLNAAVYYLIFGLLFNRKSDVSHYIPFLVTGVFFFYFTQRSITAGAKSVQNNLSLIRALHFPRATLPFSFTIVELQQLLASMTVLVVILLGFGEYPSLYWLMIIPVLLLQLMFNIGASLVVARIGAFVPDLSQLLPFILRTWLYFSGIMFALYTMATRVPSWASRLMEVNPAAVYIELARRSLMSSYRHDLSHLKVKYLAECHAPTTTKAATTKALNACKEHTQLVAMDRTVWIYAIGWAVVAFVLGFWYFYRAEERYGRG